MNIEGFIWLADVSDKLLYKHAVEINEVEEIFCNLSIFNRIEKGNVKGEDVYRVLGQANSGRHLAVFFIYKRTRDALVISARDMTEKERRHYAKRRK